MISFDRAQKRLSELELQTEVKAVAAEEAGGRVLAQSIVAREDVPGFRKSAMDGYAVRKADLAEASEEHPVELDVAGTAAAGHPMTHQLRSGTTIRIYTGAPVPPDADAVVMQERVDRINSETVRFSEPVQRTNIRSKGEELEEGDLLLEDGTVLSASAIGMLMEQGYTSVPVVRPPSVSIVNTGDELIAPGETPSPGQVRDSIGPALSVLLRQDGLDTEHRRVKDDRETLTVLLKELMEQNDLVFVSGGVSVGDRDLTRDILSDLQVEPVFWKVKQKPGKPIYLGRRQDTLVLGLPGNPVSSLVCYYLYGRPLIRKWSGFPEGEWRLPSVRTAFQDDRDLARSTRTVFARARTRQTDEGVESQALEHQGSHMLSGLARANSLVRIPAENEDQSSYQAYLLPDRMTEVFS